MLGDAGMPNDDASYTGSVDNSVASVQYWRDKALEFQRVLQSVDETANAAAEFLSRTTDQSAIAYINEALNDYDTRKTALRLAAEGINAGAAVINAAGGRFPQLSIPPGLGLAPLMPAAAIAALGTAAALIVWGKSWIDGVNERMRYAALMQSDDPEIGRILARAEAAQRVASTSTIAQIGTYLKWGAIVVVVIMALPHLKKIVPQLTRS